MIIIGTKVGKRWVGFAAEYCTVCRSASVMRIREYRMSRTIYFVPVTPGKPFQLWATCHGCDSRFVRPVGHYASLLTEASPLDDLAFRTNPSLRAEVATREEHEIALLDGSADQRARLISIDEAIRSLEADAVSRQVSGRYESVTTLVAAAAIALTAASAIATVAAPRWVWPAGVASGPFWVWLVYRAVRGQTRARGRIVDQRIARAIAFLDPTDEELRIVRDTLARAGSSVAKGLDLARLRRLIDGQIN